MIKILPATEREKKNAALVIKWATLGWILLALAMWFINQVVPPTELSNIFLIIWFFAQILIRIQALTLLLLTALQRSAWSFFWFLVLTHMLLLTSLSH